MSFQKAVVSFWNAPALHRDIDNIFYAVKWSLVHFRRMFSGAFAQGVKTMKRLVALSSVIVLLLVFAVIVVAPVGANPQPAVRTASPDQSFPAPNPCTGHLEMVYWTDLYLISRSGEDENGDVHLLTGSMHDTAGFSSHVMETSIENGRDSDNYESVYVSNVAASNPDTHQLVIATWNFHLVVKDGIPTVNITMLDVKCVGKSN